MKKLWLLATLLFGGVLLAWCWISSVSNYDLDSQDGRLSACVDRVWFYLNTESFNAAWEDEQEWWASFILNGHVVRWEEWDLAEDDVECVIDMVDRSVNVEFMHHKYNWVSQEYEGPIYTLVWPDGWYDEQLEAWKLVLRKSYDDHTDVIFIDQELWQEYLDPHKMYYWDDVIFSWALTPIDWAAWTHYYAADSIEQLEELFVAEYDESRGDSLVVVFSPTGHTKEKATFISEIVGIPLYEINPVTWYTAEDLNWRNEESRSYYEFKHPEVRPEIANDFDLDWVDTIYLWYPIWFGITPNIILTFLENYDLSGKKVVLFCTSGQVWIENSVEYLSPFNLNVIASKRFEQWATKQDVEDWLASIQ